MLVFVSYTANENKIDQGPSHSPPPPQMTLNVLTANACNPKRFNVKEHLCDRQKEFILLNV